MDTMSERLRLVQNADRPCQHLEKYRARRYIRGNTWNTWVASEATFVTGRFVLPATTRVCETLLAHATLDRSPIRRVLVLFDELPFAVDYRVLSMVHAVHNERGRRLMTLRRHAVYCNGTACNVRSPKAIIAYSSVTYLMSDVGTWKHPA